MAAHSELCAPYISLSLVNFFLLQCFIWAESHLSLSYLFC